MSVCYNLNADEESTSFLWQMLFRIVFTAYSCQRLKYSALCKRKSHGKSIKVSECLVGYSNDHGMIHSNHVLVTPLALLRIPCLIKSLATREHSMCNGVTYGGALAYITTVSSARVSFWWHSPVSFLTTLDTRIRVKVHLCFVVFRDCELWW